MPKLIDYEITVSSADNPQPITDVRLRGALTAQNYLHSIGLPRDLIAAANALVGNQLLWVTDPDNGRTVQIKRVLSLAESQNRPDSRVVSATITLRRRSEGDDDWVSAMTTDVVLRLPLRPAEIAETLSRPLMGYHRQYDDLTHPNVGLAPALEPYFLHRMTTLRHCIYSAVAGVPRTFAAPIARTGSVGAYATVDKQGRAVANCYHIQFEPKGSFDA